MFYRTVLEVFVSFKNRWCPEIVRKHCKAFAFGFRTVHLGKLARRIVSLNFSKQWQCYRVLYFVRKLKSQTLILVEHSLPVSDASKNSPVKFFPCQFSDMIAEAHLIKRTWYRCNKTEVTGSHDIIKFPHPCSSHSITPYNNQYGFCGPCTTGHHMKRQLLHLALDVFVITKLIIF